MKRVFLIIACSIYVQAVFAQLKITPVCPPFKADVLEGVINEKLDCTSTGGEIKKVFPCFTDAKEETNGAGCGGVFYKDKDIYFFTERGYIEIGEKFKGQLTPALLGAGRSSLFALLGNPQIKDVDWDAFKTKYGILIVYYNKARKINKLQLSNKGAETLKLCE